MRPVQENRDNMHGRGPGKNKEVIEMVPRRPHFLIIGVPKAGTTSLADWLSQHPEVFMPDRIKEPFFFTYAGQPSYEYLGKHYRLPSFSYNWDKYLDLFEGASDGQLIGEASTSYFHSPQSPGLIHALLPDVKLIVILRNPLERAFSHYLMDIRDGRTTLSFEEELEQEIRSRVPTRWYKYPGFYIEHLRRYLVFFRQEQIKVLLFEDITKNSKSTYRDICNFLGIDNSFTPVFEHKNAYGVYRYPAIRKKLIAIPYEHFVRRLARFLIPNFLRKKLRESISDISSTQKPQMNHMTRNQLLNDYRSQIEELQSWLQRDLSHWMNE